MIAWLQIGLGYNLAQNMVIKAVFFDAAGTLIKPTRRVGETYSLLAQKYGIEISSAEIAERFRLCFHSATPLAFPGVSTARIEDLERAWWREIGRASCR